LPPPRAYPTWVFGGLLAAILLVSGGAIAYRAVKNVSAAIGLEPSTPRANASAAKPVAVANVVEAAQPAEVADPQHPAGDSIALAEAVPPPAVPALPDAAPVETNAAAPEPPAPPSRPPPTPAELQAALQATPIVMYSATWCGVCRKAKAFLSANGLRYQEIDADETPGAWEKIDKLIGHRGVPVIIVDGELTPAGLSPSAIMRSVSHSMERRLGVKGIRFQTN
jgi:glutaredoxin